MTIYSRIKKLSAVLAVAAFAIGFMPTISQAVQCTVDTANDPNAFITGALSVTSCGLGNDNNDSETRIGQILGGTWTLIDRDQGDGTPDLSGFSESSLSFSPIGGTNGEWFVDLAGLTFTRLVLVLKDGGTGDPNPNGPPPEVGFVWFELDMNGNCIGFGGAPAGSDLCGDWSMYGNSKGQAVQLSHITLYGSGTNGPGPGQEIPEPSTLLLLGSGLIMAGVATRRFRRKPR